MVKKIFRQTVTLFFAGALAATCALAQSTPQPKEKLDDKDNPLLIGKRDINKGSINFYSLEKEVALGRQMAMEVDRQSKLITDPAINEFINRITQNLVLNSDSKVPFTVKVIDDEVVNAFALPGGFLYVYRGLIETADNEAEIAGVMAHEIAHVAARHGVEQASKGTLINYASIPLIFLGGIGGYAIQQAAGLAIPLGFLKFSRGAEQEADRLGAQYMWAAGYDPQALASFFEKLQAKDKRKPGTLSKMFSTHPYTGDRITAVNALVAKFPDRGEYQLSTSEFKDVKSRVLAASSSTRAINADADAKRPTLKRRPQNPNDRGDSTADDSAAPTDRPVLKRREGSDGTEPSSTTTPATKTTESGDRPVLKRREGSSDTPDKP
ncbi:MAG: M48 family metalloprotease [Acidobacteria bacterium]|nr:M48 family metalloprotease [Acidobacteriota bacterium]